jgi:hypothetical protein
MPNPACARGNRLDKTCWPAAGTGSIVTTATAAISPVN